MSEWGERPAVEAKQVAKQPPKSQKYSPPPFLPIRLAGCGRRIPRSVASRILRRKEEGGEGEGGGEGRVTNRLFALATNEATTCFAVLTLVCGEVGGERGAAGERGTAEGKAVKLSRRCGEPRMVFCLFIPGQRRFAGRIAVAVILAARVASRRATSPQW